MTEGSAVTHRRRAPELRREEIMQAAVKLFAEHGFERTTTKEIAREAGIAEGTIYNYFPGKQDLLFAFVEKSVVEPLASLFNQSDQVNDEQIIRGFITDRFAVWDRTRPLIKVIFSEALYNRELADALYRNVARPTVEVIESYLTRRVREGIFRPLNPKVAARALIGHLFTYFLMWDTLLGEMNDPLPRQLLIDELTNLFLNGVMSHPQHGVDSPALQSSQLVSPEAP